MLAVDGCDRDTELFRVDAGELRNLVRDLPFPEPGPEI